MEKMTTRFSTVQKVAIRNKGEEMMITQYLDHIALCLSIIADKLSEGGSNK